MEKRPFGQQKSDRFQEQKPVISMANSDIEKHRFLTAKFVAFAEPLTRQISNESRSTKEQKKRGMQAHPKYPSI